MRASLSGLQRAAGATLVEIRWHAIATRPEGLSRRCIARQASSQRHYGDQRFPTASSLALNPVQGKRLATVNTLPAGGRSLVRRLLSRCAGTYGSLFSQSWVDRASSSSHRYTGIGHA